MVVTSHSTIGSNIHRMESQIDSSAARRSGRERRHMNPHRLIGTQTPIISERFLGAVLRRSIPSASLFRERTTLMARRVVIKRAPVNMTRRVFIFKLR